MTRAADLPVHPWPGAGGQGGRGRRPPGSPATSSSSSPFPPSSPPCPPWQCHSWATAHHGDAPVCGHRCGTAPREGGRGQPALPKAGEGCQPQPRRDGAGSWAPCWGRQSSFSKVSSGMSVRKGRSQKRVLMPKPVDRGERPVSPWCCCHQDAAGDRGQVTACSTLTGEGGVPAFQGGRKARQGQGGRAEGAEGAGWAMSPAPWMIAYLDGAFSPRKPAKGQVEQALGWGRCGADAGKPGASPCARQRLPAERDAAPGRDGYPHPSAAGTLPPPQHSQEALVPAGETDCRLHRHAGSPSSIWGAEKHAPWSCSTSYATSPAARCLVFPIPNRKHQIFQSISCTHAGRLGSCSPHPHQHVPGTQCYLIFGVQSGA